MIGWVLVGGVLLGVVCLGWVKGEVWFVVFFDWLGCCCLLVVLFLWCMMVFVGWLIRFFGLFGLVNFGMILIRLVRFFFVFLLKLRCFGFGFWWFVCCWISWFLLYLVFLVCCWWFCFGCVSFWLVIFGIDGYFVRVEFLVFGGVEVGLCE